MSDSSAAAVKEDRRRELYVKLNGKKPDGSSYQCLRGMYPLRNSLVINFPSFGGTSTMGGSCGWLFYLGDCDGEEAVIINPMMGEFKFLPPSLVKRPPGSNCLIVYGFGFGFDSLRQDYKVIRFVLNGFENYDKDGSYVGGAATGKQAELYSLESNSWREIPFSNDDKRLVLYGSGCSVNGKCYWIGLAHLISFDFEKESFSFIPFPNLKENVLKGSFQRDLHEYKGSLAVIWLTHGSLEAWVLKEEEWEKVFDVKSCGYICRTLGFGKYGEVLFLEGVLFEGDAEAGCEYAAKFGENKSGTSLIEFDILEKLWTQHPIFNEEGSMQIFSFSPTCENYVWLEDAQKANPIKVDGGESIDIFPSVVESTSSEQTIEDEDECMVENLGEEMFLGDDGMELIPCIESPA